MRKVVLEPRKVVWAPETRVLVLAVEVLLQEVSQADSDRLTGCSLGFDAGNLQPLA